MQPPELAPPTRLPTDAVTLPPPPCSASTVPYWVAVLASLVALVLSILVAELWLGWRLHADATDAVATVLHFLVDGISAFIVTGLATTVRGRSLLRGQGRPPGLRFPTLPATMGMLGRVPGPAEAQLRHSRCC